MTFPLRPYLPTDAAALADIFRESFYDLAAEDYDEDQRAAWMDSISDEDAFAERLASQLTLVALDAGEPAGFISLKDNTYIDMIYVLPGFAREGAGTALLEAVMKLAVARGAETLTADVSDNAKAFFETFDFVPEKRNMLILDDEYLGNTTMRKPLSEAARSAMNTAREQAMRVKS